MYRQVRDIRCVLEGHPPLVLEARSGFFSWKEDFLGNQKRCLLLFVMEWHGPWHVVFFFCQKMDGLIFFLMIFFFLCFLFKCWVWFLLIFTQQKWKKDKYEAITGHSWTPQASGKCVTQPGETKLWQPSWFFQEVRRFLVPCSRTLSCKLTYIFLEGNWSNLDSRCPKISQEAT